MRRALLPVVLLFAAVAATTSRAQQISGNELYRACQSDGAVLGGFCIGYLIGTIEGRSAGAFAVLKSSRPDLDPATGNEMINSILGHCIPQDATNEQLRDVAVKYMSSHPESRHIAARTLVWIAFREAFPCR